MSCGPIQTGQDFVQSILSHIDCQAQTIGTYGYAALATPGSSSASILSGLLTLLVALYGFRLMFGWRASSTDLISDILRIGIVLTLATSWPAWRTLGYDIVLTGPSQLAAQIGGASALPGTQQDLNQRLQSADEGIVALTAFGSGRLTGGVTGSADLGDSTRGIALADQSGFAWGRVLFLAGTIGPLALVRLGAGILLALAPLVAGLLLFAGTRDIFLGWLRALAGCALASLALILCYGVQLGIMESWLADALQQREGNILTAAAPTELLVISLAFALLACGILVLSFRWMFFSSYSVPMLPNLWAPASVAGYTQSTAQANRPADRFTDMPRAQTIAESVSSALRREERHYSSEMSRRTAEASSDTYPGRAERKPGTVNEPLGTSFRRGHRRKSAAAGRRDIQS